MFDFKKYIKTALGKRGTLPPSEIKFFETVIAQWKASEERAEQITGHKYYLGDHDILRRVKKMVGREPGRLVPVNIMANNKIVDNQYAIMVDQKTNYLYGKPFVIKAENKNYEKALKDVLNDNFFNVLNQCGKSGFNGGVGWLNVFYNEDNELDFDWFYPHEVISFEKRGEIECLLRVYKPPMYAGAPEEDIEKVEIYTVEGVRFFDLIAGVLTPDMETPQKSYVQMIDGEEIRPYNWAKIPIIPLPYNSERIPLIRKCKSIQDAINLVHSDFRNDMEENSAGSGIMVVKNYGGENLGEFRHNLMTFKSVKVNVTQDQPGGGVDVLTIDINPENYKAELEAKKLSLIENAMGFDAKMIRSNAPNRMNIKSMYSNIELDGNKTETEFQAAFKKLLWFIHMHFINTGVGDFTAENIEVELNRDMLMNESEIIEDIAKSPQLSLQTQLENHPMVPDVEVELKRIEEQRSEEEEIYGMSPMHRQPPAEEPPAE